MLMCGVCGAQPVTLQLALESEFAGRVHPLVLRLGLDYADGKITGGNARCVALLATLRQVIQVGSPRPHPPPHTQVARGLVGMDASKQPKRPAPQQ